MDGKISAAPVLLAIFASLFAYYWLRSSKRSNLPLPPGPRTLPLIGNALNVPHEYPWLALSKLAKELDTDIMHLDMAGRSMIVLESDEAVTELLERRSAIYSSRPISRVVHHLLGWSWAIFLMPYGDQWKERRKLFCKYFHPSNSSLHQVHEVEHLSVFLNGLLEDPKEFISHIRHTIGAIAIAMAYGIKVERTHDPHLQLAEETIEHLSEAVIPGSFFVEFLPFLEYIPEWFPGGGWKARIRKLKQEEDDFLNKPYKAALQAIENSTSTDSFFSRYYQDLPGGRLTKEEEKPLKETAAQIFIAGADTTVSALSTFFLAMVTFPEVFKKAQHEVDSVLKGRLLTHADMASMPYMLALLKEVMRWQPVLPLGLFHSLLQDDVYKGYHIPADSIVYANIWALTHDPIEFPEPDVLKPERFLKDGKLHVAGRDPTTLSFGFGRRACPGGHVAESMWFICAASVLALFDISKAQDEKGNIIEPNCEYNSSGTIRQPGSFICSIKPRSQETVNIIRSLV